jgi:hypothetical protein
MLKILDRGIFLVGATLIGASVKAPRIKSKNLVRYYFTFVRGHLKGVLILC